MVLLIGITDNEKEGKLCGGTIIDELTIVTAAHCIVSPKDPSKMFVFVGLHDRSKLSEADYYKPSRI